MNSALQDRFWKNVEKSTANECWIWHGSLNTKGYGHFAARGIKTATAHRQSWIIANGPVPEGLEIAHSCHNRRCVNPAHLSAVTHAENMRHSAQAKRLPCQSNPEKTNLRKLTREQVLEIRASLLPAKEIAPLFQTTTSNIHVIRRRQSWKHI